MSSLTPGMNMELENPKTLLSEEHSLPKSIPKQEDHKNTVSFPNLNMDGNLVDTDQTNEVVFLSESGCIEACPFDIICEVK